MSFSNSEAFFPLILACLFRIPSNSLLLNQLHPPQLLSFSPGSLLILKSSVVLGHSKQGWVIFFRCGYWTWKSSRRAFLLFSERFLSWLFQSPFWAILLFIYFFSNWSFISNTYIDLFHYMYMLIWVLTIFFLVSHQNLRNKFFFLASPVVKTLCFHCKGHRFNPGSWPPPPNHFYSL